MIIIRIADKRCHRKYRLRFFKTDSITDDIIQFVRDNSNAYWIESKNEIYRNRDDFFENYN